MYSKASNCEEEEQLLPVELSTHTQLELKKVSIALLPRLHMMLSDWPDHLEQSNEKEAKGKIGLPVRRSPLFFPK